MFCRFIADFPGGWYAVRAPPRKSETRLIFRFSEERLWLSAVFMKKPWRNFLMCSRREHFTSYDWRQRATEGRWEHEPVRMPPTLVGSAMPEKAWYAKEHGFEVVGTSSDIASGLKFDHRPGLLEFHNEAVDGDVDILLVCDLDVSVHTADCGTVDLSFDATLYEIIEEIRKRTKRGWIVSCQEEKEKIYRFFSTACQPCRGNRKFGQSATQTVRIFVFCQAAR